MIILTIEGAFLASRNAMQVPAIYVQGKVYHVWPKGSANANGQIKEAVEGIQCATKLMLDRLASELPQGDLRMQLSLFNLRVWMKSDSHKQSFRRVARLWFQMLKFSRQDCDVGAEEYNDAACFGLHL